MKVVSEDKINGIFKILKEDGTRTTLQYHNIHKHIYTHTVECVLDDGTKLFVSNVNFQRIVGRRAYSKIFNMDSFWRDLQLPPRELLRNNIQ